MQRSKTIYTAKIGKEVEYTKRASTNDRGNTKKRPLLASEKHLPIFVVSFVLASAAVGRLLCDI